MTEIATPVAPVVTAKPGVPHKLTADQETEMYAFMGKCAFNNVGLAASGKFAVQTRLTVQDLCNCTVKTLQNIGISIKKANMEKDDDFGNGEDLKISGVLADKWITFLKLLIQKKIWDEYAKKMRATKRELLGNLETFKTDAEKRQEVEKKLADLGAVPEEEI